MVLLFQKNSYLLKTENFFVVDSEFQPKRREKYPNNKKQQFFEKKEPFFFFKISQKKRRKGEEEEVRETSGCACTVTRDRHNSWDNESVTCHERNVTSDLNVSWCYAKNETSKQSYFSK